MMRIHRAKKVILILLAIILVPFMAIVLLRPLGVYIDEPGWSVAETAAEKGNVSHCKRIFIMPWQVFDAGTTSHRRSCIHEYASLTKDPTACELIMPSSYGLSCLGEAREVSRLCYFKSNEIVWGKGADASFQECISGTEKQKNNSCCIMYRISSLEGEDDCSVLQYDNDLHDQCLEELALKKRDVAVCVPIKNNNIRSICEMRTAAVKEKPSICPDC